MFEEVITLSLEALFNGYYNWEKGNAIANERDKPFLAINDPIKLFEGLISNYQIIAFMFKHHRGGCQNELSKPQGESGVSTYRLSAELTSSAIDHEVVNIGGNFHFLGKLRGDHVHRRTVIKDGDYLCLMDGNYNRLTNLTNRG